MKNILIVDHDEIMLQVFVALLKSQGGFLNVLSAKSGKCEGVGNTVSAECLFRVVVEEDSQ